jgi:uncharacterized protein (DUF488 family)
MRGNRALACHRQLIADTLVARGVTVRHISACWARAELSPGASGPKRY